MVTTTTEYIRVFFPAEPVPPAEQTVTSLDLQPDPECCVLNVSTECLLNACWH